jgi:RecA/RadA recombinase
MPPAKKAAKKAKAKKEVEVLSPEAAFERQLVGVGLAGTLKLADEGGHYVVQSTGWPGVDELIGGNKLHHRGVPRHCHLEIFSEIEGVGKTSFALGVGVAWQMAKLRVGVIDIEPSITTPYLTTLKYITSKKEAEAKGLYAVRLLQPQVKINENTTDMIYVEQILDIISAASNLFDLLIVDSVDFLVSEADALKKAETANQVGGVSKYIKEFMRNNTKRRSTILWINHMSQGIGQYARAYTTGGKAIPRASTVRLKLERVDLLRENKEADPYGFSTKVSTVKNRLGGAFRYTILNYIFDEGFSVDYDYYMQALKLGIITQNAAWYYVGNKDKSVLKGQGKFNFYKVLRDEQRDIFDQIKTLIDGEDVPAEELTAEMTAEELLDAKMAAAEEEETEELVPSV